LQCAKKLVFFTLNANILQSKKLFSIFFTLYYRNGNFKCFFAEKGLGPLGVKKKTETIFLDSYIRGKL